MPIGGPGGPGIKKEGGQTIENSMVSAATYEQLLSVWTELNKQLDFLQATEYKTLVSRLRNVFTCFGKSPFECDSSVKNIFENDKLRRELKNAGISEEFLLHTVRMGAIKGVQAQIERNPDQPVELHPDGTMFRLIIEQIEGGRLTDPKEKRERLALLIRQIANTPTLDGYSWANQELKTLEEKKKTAQKGKLEESKQQIEREKLSALGRIKAGMRAEGFRLSKEDANLLRQDFATKLILWKAVLESGVGAVLSSFLYEYGNLELTPEIFAKFKSFYENNAEIRDLRLGRADLPLEIIDPNSGWFAVLLINKKTKLREFVSSAYSNINSWFEL